MRRFLFLSMIGPACYAASPLYTHPTPPGLDDEIKNIYHVIQSNANTIVGAVIQSSQTLTTASTSTASNSFVNTAVTVGITPLSATSKVRVTMNGDAYKATAGKAYYTIARNGTNLAGANGLASYNVGTAAGSDAPFTLVYFDSPASTSTLTYTLQLRSDDANTAYNGLNGTSMVALAEEISQ